MGLISKIHEHYQLTSIYTIYIFRVELLNMANIYRKMEDKIESNINYITLGKINFPCALT